MYDIMAYIKVEVRASSVRGQIDREQSNRGKLDSAVSQIKSKVIGKHSGTKYYRRILTCGRTDKWLFMLSLYIISVEISLY